MAKHRNRKRGETRIILTLLLFVVAMIYWLLPRNLAHAPGVWLGLLLMAAVLLMIPGLLQRWLQRQSRDNLLQAQRGLHSIRALSWQDFERLVGAAYRHHGYRISETGGGGADGGVDLVLHKDGQTLLVQCKQWNRGNVGAPVVREMYGLMAHHHAQGVKIITANAFTKDALAFAAGKPIELVDGAALAKLVAAVQRPTVTVAGVPACPRCGGEMVKRHSPKTGRMFYGCRQYPACTGTSPMQ